MNYIDKYCKFDREYNIHEYYHYVEDVLNHRIVTSKAIYLACKRFERWLSRTDIYFDEKDVDQRINLIYLMKHTKGKCAGQHFKLLIQSSFDDVMATTTTLLGRDYALTMDCELRDVALSGTNIVYGGGKTSREELTASDKLTVSTIKDAIEILATNNAPKYGGAYWICFVHPHQSRDLRDDSAWINASNYGAPEQLFTGEIGRIDDTRFIETTLMCNGKAKNADPSFRADLVKGYKENEGTPLATNVYQAVIFGDQYYGIAWSLPVELRDNGVEDFGRKRSLAWYAIWGTGLLHNDYGVVIETA